MKKMITSLAAIFFGLIASAEAQHEGALPEKLQAFIKKLDADKGLVQGCAMAVMYQGRVVYQSTSGHQKGNAGPITSRTLFPVASASKAISSMAIALMVDASTINLDLTMALPFLEKPVTLKQILSHTTGYAFSGNRQIEQGLPRQQLLAVLKGEKPQCPPGSCYTYSNTIFSLVDDALVLQRSSLKAAIAQMCVQLKTDGIQLLPLQPGRVVAFPHTQNKQTKAITALPFPQYYPKVAPAAAGIFASLDGMIEVFKLSFGYRHDLIAQKTLNLFHTSVSRNHDLDRWHLPVPTDQIQSSYALGWRIVQAKHKPDTKMIFHGGMIAGINAFIGWIPAHDMGLVILTNDDTFFAMREAMALWETLGDGQNK